MEAKEIPQPHTQLTKAIDTDSAIIMGDPARVDTIAKLMDHVVPWACNREYKSIIGMYKGKKILAMSTGIGAPSAGIAVEEMHNVGIISSHRQPFCATPSLHPRRFCRSHAA